MSVAQACMALEHLEQVAHLLAFGTNWRQWEWRMPPTLTIRQAQTLAHISYLEKASKKCAKKVSAPISKVYRFKWATR